jgi:hypothetical protein
LADLVIPDLARWQDWESMDELVKLFKTADEKSSWVRVPVINFLRACPLPEAKDHLVELEKIDPAAAKRANMFFPVPNTGGTAPTDNKASDVRDAEAETGLIAATPARLEEGRDFRGAQGDFPNLASLLCVPGVIGLGLFARRYYFKR